MAIALIRPILGSAPILANVIHRIHRRLEDKNMKGLPDERRNFLKGLTLALGALVLPLAPSLAHSKQEASAMSTLPSGREIIDVSIRGDLFSPPVAVQLSPGMWSDVIHLHGRGAYRVRVTPLRVDPRFGEVFALTLGDLNGREIDRMNVGNSTTATFAAFGVQVYLVSVRLPD